ncbi:MAG: exonuclease SbcCD subunit D C-terminal domain-containing protein [Deltaproteobacteria bacterium]|nr:exonuclease SbcCD subunit D C-terminal domain-containing protein [Deltaproteobacteria bacterium]
MRILHTSDWHLGQHLMMNDRKREHELFLDWLIECLQNKAIDVLIVAGDIFDTGTPPNYALQLYYNFLHRITETPCRQAIIIGGNHDSVSTLHAPKELLKFFRVHVIGGMSGNLDDEIIVIHGPDGNAQGIICAVPYLRDRDIRQSLPGESYEDKSRALLDGVKSHYQQLKTRALTLRENATKSGWIMPLITTGHLFTAGGQTSDGVRDIYVGSLGQVHASSFPTEFDYVALGHLHKPQNVGGYEHIRYSGSPIALSFSEAETGKEIVIVDFDDVSTRPQIEAVPIPEFQKLRRLKGNFDQITEKLKTLDYPDNGDRIWAEVTIDTEDWVPEVQNTISAMAEGYPVDILAVKNIRAFGKRILNQGQKRETLQELTPIDVFRKRLEAEEGIDEKIAEDLLHAFNEIQSGLF